MIATVMRASDIGKEEAEEQLQDMLGDFDEMLRRSSDALRQTARSRRPRGAP